MPMSLIILLVGILLLVAGRKLYWLSVGALGFLAGMMLALEFLPELPVWLPYVVALCCGIAGTFVAIFLQKVAIVVIGFLTGGFFLATSFPALQIGTYEPFWISFAIGGIVGAILLVFVFDWALIAISSVTGAYFVTRELHASHSSEPVFWIIFAVVGVAIQSSMMKKKGKRTPASSGRKPAKENDEKE